VLNIWQNKNEYLAVAGATGGNSFN